MTEIRTRYPYYYFITIREKDGDVVIGDRIEYGHKDDRIIFETPATDYEFHSTSQHPLEKHGYWGDVELSSGMKMRPYAEIGEERRTDWETHLLTDEQAKVVLYGYSWGILPLDGWQDLPTITTSGLNRSVLYVPPPATVVKWDPAAEIKAATHLKSVVTEGLLEVPSVSYAHWKHEANVLADIGSDALEGRPTAAHLRSEITRLIPVTSGKLQAAALALLELRYELKTKFDRAGTSFDKVHAVCKEYLKGDLGIDWHCRGYFHKLRAYSEWRAETETLDAQAKTMNRLRHGFTNTHFAPDSLSPMFAKYPALKTVYHP